jgi:hypothetical protein
MPVAVKTNPMIEIIVAVIVILNTTGMESVQLIFSKSIQSAL